MSSINISPVLSRRTHSLIAIGKALKEIGHGITPYRRVFDFNEVHEDGSPIPPASWYQTSDRIVYGTYAEAVVHGVRKCFPEKYEL